MPHLVTSLTSATHGDAGVLSLASCHALLRSAHDYLARQGAEATLRAARVTDLAGWGSTLKRVRVALPGDGRPAIVRDDGAEHSLAEVVNQCATMERLLDALAWAQTPASGLDSFHVVRCHPTTSSAAAGVGADHDLVLTSPEGRAAWFEVSDVANSDDGNRKEEKDLRSLGLLRDGSGPERCDVPRPEGYGPSSLHSYERNAPSTPHVTCQSRGASAPRARGTSVKNTARVPSNACAATSKSSNARW